MAKISDIIREYTDYENKKIKIVIQPAIIRKDLSKNELDYNVQFDIFDLRHNDGNSTNIILNEYQVRNLQTQLSSILKHFYDLKNEGK